MAAPIPPMLCRYVGPAGVNILRSGKLAYVPPSDFNDPFDTSPGVCAQFTEEELRDLFVKAKASEPSAQHVQFSQFQAEFENQRGDFKRGVHDELLGGINARFGVVCLSELVNDPLMWSLYAEKHTGIAICFDTSHPWVAKEFGKVIYRKHRPAFGLVFQETPDEAFITKGECWAREAEWRGLAHLEDCEKVEANGRTFYLKPFPRDAVNLVVLGCRCSAALRDEIYGNLRAWGFCNAKLAITSASRTDYELHTLTLPVPCWGS